MALFRRLLLVALLALGAGAVFAAVPAPVSAGQCLCGCTVDGSGGAFIEGGSACTGDNNCTVYQCEADCAAVGASPSPPARGILYTCIDPVTRRPVGSASTAPAPAPTRAPTPAPDPAATPDATPPPGGAAGGNPVAPAAPTNGVCRFHCGATAGGSGQVATQSVSCRNNADCASACTNRCSVGPGAEGSGLAAGLTCSDSPSPECVFPRAETPASAPSAGSGSLRFSLPTCTETGNCTLTDIVNTGVRFANFLIAFSGVIFLMTFLYAGAWLLFFAYDSSAIKKAQGMITGAAIGIVIVMTAGVAVRFVGTSLGVRSSSTRLPGTTVPSESGAGGGRTGAGGAPAPRSLGSTGGVSSSGGTSGTDPFTPPPAEPGAPAGSCQCGLSAAGRIAMGVASDEDIATARSRAESRCRSLRGTADAEGISCTAPSTEAQCDFMNDSSPAISCDWTSN